MNRRDVLRHIERQGCKFLREGSRHTIYFNPKTRQTSSIPRYREIVDVLVRKICKDLNIPPPFVQE